MARKITVTNRGTLVVLGVVSKGNIKVIRKGGIFFLWVIIREAIVILEVISNWILHAYVLLGCGLWGLLVVGT